MAVIVYVVPIIMFLVLVGWTWSNLGDINKNKKIGYTVISILIMFLITFIIFSISRKNVNYENEKMVGPVRLLLVTVFTSINGYVVIQYIARILSKIYLNDIEQDSVKRKFLLIFVIFIFIAIIECVYMKNIQIGILDIFNRMQ